MKEYKIEPGDHVAFNKINFTKENCVVSNEMLAFLDRTASVEEVKDGKIRCYGIDEWIPMEWVKGITYKGLSDKEKEREHKLEEVRDRIYENMTCVKLEKVWYVFTVALFIGFIVLFIASAVISGFSESIASKVLIAAIISTVLSIANAIVFGCNYNKLDEYEDLKLAELLYKEIPFTFQESVRLTLGISYVGKYLKSIGKEADFDKIEEYRNERIEY